MCSVKVPSLVPLDSGCLLTGIGDKETRKKHRSDLSILLLAELKPQKGYTY